MTQFKHELRRAHNQAEHPGCSTEGVSVGRSKRQKSDVEDDSVENMSEDETEKSVFPNVRNIFEDSDENYDADLEELAELTDEVKLVDKTVMETGDLATIDLIKLPTQDPDKMDEDKESDEDPADDDELFQITHEGAFLTEEMLYNFFIDFGKITNITDCHGNDVDEKSILPKQIILTFSSTNVRNRILDLNFANVRITPLNQSQRWKKAGNIFKNISDYCEFWKNQDGVVCEEDMVNEFPPHATLIINLKKSEEVNEHYTKVTYICLTGKKVLSEENHEGKLCLRNVLKTKTVHIPGRQEWIKQRHRRLHLFLSSADSIEVLKSPATRRGKDKGDKDTEGAAAAAGAADEALIKVEVKEEKKELGVGGDNAVRKKDEGHDKVDTVKRENEAARETDDKEKLKKKLRLEEIRHDWTVEETRVSDVKMEINKDDGLRPWRFEWPGE